ncbi:CAP domain-containing protein [Nocardia sp. NPDC004582]
MYFKRSATVITCLLVGAAASPVAALSDPPIWIGTGSSQGPGVGSAQPPAPGGAPSDPQTDAARTGVLDLVNAERARQGCGGLRPDARLQSAAQGHSDDMAARVYFDHRDPDGRMPNQRVEAAGYLWRTVGENIARGQADAAEVMADWMASPGHRANILNCAYTDIGIGVHFGTEGPLWTQNFAAPL